MKSRKYQIAAWTAFAAIVFVTVSPIEMRPGDIFSVDIDRALAFGLMSSMFMVAYPRHAFLVGACVVLSAGGMELLQALSPTRHARLDDAIVKGAGALAGAIFAYGYNALRQVRYERRATRQRVREALATLAAARDAGGVQKLPVASDFIEAVYFSPADGRLRVRLRSGEERVFGDVGEGEVASLISAPSPATYYLEKIKDRFPRLAA